MQMLKHCLNWKVIAGLAAVGVGIYLVAPELAAAILPILVLAICPVSMIMMMLVMQGSQGGGHRASQETDAGLTREGRIVRLQAEALADRIATLEQKEPQPTKDGKGR